MELRFCISNKSPAEANAAGLRTNFYSQGSGPFCRCPVMCSVPMAVFSTCAAQYSSHQPHRAIESLKDGQLD